MTLLFRDFDRVVLCQVRLFEVGLCWKFERVVPCWALYTLSFYSIKNKEMCWLTTSTFCLLQPPFDGNMACAVSPVEITEVFNTGITVTHHHRVLQTTMPVLLPKICKHRNKRLNVLICWSCLLRCSSNLCFLEFLGINKPRAKWELYK